MPQDTIYGDGMKDRKKPEGPDSIHQESLVRPFVNGYHDRKLMHFFAWIHECPNAAANVENHCSHPSFFPTHEGSFTPPEPWPPWPTFPSSPQGHCVAIHALAAGFRHYNDYLWPFSQQLAVLIAARSRDFGHDILKVFCTLVHHAGRLAFRKVPEEQNLDASSIIFPFNSHFGLLYKWLYYVILYSRNDGFSRPFSGYFMTLMSDMEWPCHPARGRPRTAAVVKQICDQRGDDGNKIKWTSNLGCSPASIDVYWCILL